MKITIKKIEPSEFTWVNQRYVEVDFKPSAPTDLIVLAEVDGHAAGLGRIVPLEHDVGELGGMLVFAGYQGRGLAKAIIRFLIQNTDCRELYCLPFADLEHLYASFGFTCVEASPDMPEQVLEKYKWCNAFYAQPVLLMKLRLDGYE